MSTKYRGDSLCSSRDCVTIHLFPLRFCAGVYLSSFTRGLTSCQLLQCVRVNPVIQSDYRRLAGLGCHMLLSCLHGNHMLPDFRRLMHFSCDHSSGPLSVHRCCSSHATQLGRMHPTSPEHCRTTQNNIALFVY